MSDNEAIKEVLIKAKETISNPENWTKGVMALDRNGNSVSTLSEKAVCFCSFGAVHRNELNFSWQRVDEALDFICVFCEKETGFSLMTFNDRSSHKEVLNLFDSAISFLESKEV